jgi:hypothetical protein
VVVQRKEIKPEKAEAFCDLVESRYSNYRPCIVGPDKRLPRTEHAFRRLCELIYPTYKVTDYAPGKMRMLINARAAGEKYGLDFETTTFLLADSYLHSRAVEITISTLLKEQRTNEAKVLEAVEDVTPLYSHTMEAYNYKNYLMSLFEQGIGWDGTKLDGPKDDPSEDNDPERYALIG